MFLFKSARSSDKVKAAKKTLLQHFSANSVYAEAYRTLRTNLNFSLMENELKSIVLTSAVQGEGKTNTVANLAYTIAQTGKTVVMVDADLRKPGLTTRFSASGHTGLSNLISVTLGEHLVQGKIANYGLKDLIKICSLQRRTCRMNIADNFNEVELVFIKGELLDIYWKNRPDSKKLANLLLREKILTNEEATLALGHQKKSLRRLGVILLSMGYVKEKDLQRMLFAQILEAFRITTSMSNGVFLFKSATEEDVDPANSNSFDFKRLYREFVVSDVEKSYINNAIKKAVMRTGHDNLFLLPSGIVPPNPSELIGSEKTSYLLTLLKEKFDVVIIDSSPVMPASDALLLAPQTDGVVLVVQSGGINKKYLKDVVQQLENAQANILGVTLNLIDRTKDESYKYYKSYYGE